MIVLNVVGVDGAEALDRRRGERDAGGATDVVHLLHLTYTSLKHAEEKITTSIKRQTPLNTRFPLLSP